MMRSLDYNLIYCSTLSTTLPNVDQRFTSIISTRRQPDLFGFGKVIQLRPGCHVVPERRRWGLQLGTRNAKPICIFPVVVFLFLQQSIN